MSNAKFLDIDESLKTKNLLLPDKERDALDDKLNKLKEKLDTRSTILVQPAPGICVKTKTTSGEKVFVNICTSDKIQAPEDISEDKLFNLLNHEQSDYTIPVNLGAEGERMEMDKSNVPCATFDVMINTTYFKKCQEKEHFMAFTILAILSGLSEKSGKEINCENFVILKNRTVMGKLQQQYIQKRWLQDIKKPEEKKPLIEIIPQVKKPVSKEVCLQDSTQVDTGYMILKQPLEDPVESLIALFDMPKTVSIDDVVVLVNSDRINVTDEKTCSRDVLLPYAVKKDSAKAYFDYNLGILRVDVLVQ
ncbi:PIH1 domain-containing protein 1-like isoform X2 [Odontomachus brunneus]|uniref:PIH1 domain-containing protein 1-like isoform X2 n=1 Tax=Odontomachus brunneus TaxID=486640 RepID=UPI0013F1C4A2|nr:PIH1 domain-containing protein 1-like isoform X2 [Odontomachus brunneus]